MTKITIPAKIENLERMINFIQDGIETVGFSKKELNQVHLVCEESLLNIINYAYPDSEGNIDISYDITDNAAGNGTSAQKTIRLQFVDSGIPFNPLMIPEPDIDGDIEEREIGGLGIFLVRKIMNDVQYQREGDKNILTLTKIFGN